MTRLTVVFGEREDLASLSAIGDLWAEDTPVNRLQIEGLWKAGTAATLFAPKDLWRVLEDADLHHPN